MNWTKVKSSLIEDNQKYKPRKLNRKSVAIKVEGRTPIASSDSRLTISYTLQTYLDRFFVARHSYFTKGYFTRLSFELSGIKKSARKVSC